MSLKHKHAVYLYEIRDSFSYDWDILYWQLISIGDELGVMLSEKICKYLNHYVSIPSLVNIKPVGWHTNHNQPGSIMLQGPWLWLTTNIILNSIWIWSAGWPELVWPHSSWHQFSCPPLWGLPDSLHGEMIFTMVGNKINCSRQRLNVSAGPGPLRITRNFRTTASCSQQWTKLTISPTASGKEVDIENWIRHFKIFRIFLWKV